MKSEEIREVILETLEESLSAQLRAIRRMRSPGDDQAPMQKSRSQVDIVIDILRSSGSPLHINEIIRRVQEIHGISISRESIVSALTKKIAKGDPILRTGRNIFTIRPGEKQC
jgi:hypothetical protein